MPHASFVLGRHLNGEIEGRLCRRRTTSTLSQAFERMRREPGCCCEADFWDDWRQFLTALEVKPEVCPENANACRPKRMEADKVLATARKQRPPIHFHVGRGTQSAW